MSEWAISKWVMSEWANERMSEFPALIVSDHGRKSLHLEDLVPNEDISVIGAFLHNHPWRIKTYMLRGFYVESWKTCYAVSSTVDSRGGYLSPANTSYIIPPLPNLTQITQKSSPNRAPREIGFSPELPPPPPHLALFAMVLSFLCKKIHVCHGLPVCIFRLYIHSV